MASAKLAKGVREVPAAVEVCCPKCGTDVMVTGWTEVSMRTKTYMRFMGRGAVLIGSTDMCADQAVCLCCTAQLPLTPLEMMRLA